jgi:Fe-S cluster assembly scaffold protein SufB
MLCGNDSIIISAGELDTTLKYKWSTGDTTRTLQIYALSPSSPKAADTLWVVVTNKYHGHYTDTFVLKRCNSFTVAMKVINNMVPKNGRNAGTAAKFNVWIINATIAATDSFTVWYYVENDNLDTTSVTFGAGQQSGIVSIKTNPYNSYFTGNANKSNDVERTVVILKAQISSREMVQIQKGATTSDKFYILHKPTIKEIKYVP